MILHSGGPWCWWTRCGGSSAQQWGWRRLSCVPRAGMWKVWKQRAQLQARVFRQSVLSLMLRLVPHYKQQQAALILSLVQKCRHSRQSSCRCLQGSCVTDPWCQPGHRAGESHTILPPLSLKFPSVPESNTGNCLHDPGQLPTWVEPLNKVSLLPKFVPITHGNSMSNGNNSGGAVEQEGPFYVHSVMRCENCTLL